MRWCRLYNETPSDPKLRRIAHQAGTTVANVLAVWTSMLCHAAANEGDAWGSLDGWDDLDHAINLGLDRQVVGAIRREMEGRVILEKRLIKWHARQSTCDTSTERVRKWREKKANENKAAKPDETLRSVSETPCNGIRGEESRREETPLRESGARAARGARLALDWQPSDADAGFAASLGLDPDRVAASFRDYWTAQPGARGRKSDWAATWRNWCRREGQARPAQQRESRMAWLIRDMQENP